MPSQKVSSRPLAADERRERTQRYRREAVRGVVMTLVPYGAQHIDDICRLRNTERARYYLNQEAPLTPEKQRNWTAGYEARWGDLYWMIQAPDGRIVGATALYDIDEAGASAEIGRLVVDEKVAFEAPYALEADLLVLRLAFADLGVARVTTIVRHENEKMNSMNARFGFLPCGTRDVRGTLYGEYDLDAERFDPNLFDGILTHWSKRNERRGTKSRA